MSIKVVIINKVFFFFSPPDHLYQTIKWINNIFILLRRGDPNGQCRMRPCTYETRTVKTKNKRREWVMRNSGNITEHQPRYTVISMRKYILQRKQFERRSTNRNTKIVAVITSNWSWTKRANRVTTRNINCRINAIVSRTLLIGKTWVTHGSLKRVKKIWLKDSVLIVEPFVAPGQFVFPNGADNIVVSARPTDISF